MSDIEFMELILTIGAIHLVACLSPGPDIFLVVLNSLRHDRRIGHWTTLGILTGVSLQIALGITGLTLILTQGETVGRIIGLAGGGWLAWLGIRGIRHWRRQAPQVDEPVLEPVDKATAQSAFLQGLFVNLLNPKAFLYFLSIFSIMLGSEVPLKIKVVSGLTMISVQALAFSSVAILVDTPHFKLRWNRLQVWLDLAISCILLSLGLWIWIHTLLHLMN